MKSLSSALRRRLKASVGRVVPSRIRKVARYRYASVYSMFGLSYFPAHNGLDRKLLKYVGHIRDGVFIEAGANDGLSQSNTWHLEKALGWTGLLVEPIPTIAELCRQFRPKSIIRNCALGSFEQEGTTTILHYGALMTAVEGADVATMHGGSVHAHAQEGAQYTGDKSYTFTSEIHTITKLATDAGLFKINLFSLDVEGFEINVINGIDFDRLEIQYFLIETSNFDAVKNLLSPRYRLVEKLSEHDYLFKRN